MTFVQYRKLIKHTFRQSQHRFLLLRLMFEIKNIFQSHDRLQQRSSSSLTSPTITSRVLTFSAEQRGGALQEVSDLLQRSFLSAADADLGVVATRWGRALIKEQEAQLARTKQLLVRAASEFWVRADNDV